MVPRHFSKVNLLYEFLFPISLFLLPLISLYRDYLKGIVINSENVQINCPFVDEDGVECNKTISEREIHKVRKCFTFFYIMPTCPF